MSGRPGYQWRRTAKVAAGFAKRRARALPRWREAWLIRNSTSEFRGYRFIAEMFGVRIPSAFRWVMNYESVLLDAKPAAGLRIERGGA